MRYNLILPEKGVSAFISVEKVFLQSPTSKLEGFFCENAKKWERIPKKLEKFQKNY